jgi:peptide-methionine (S)-S-oxide reductase
LGGCHWCTEAVFQSLKGVAKVEQGSISPKSEGSFSEAVIVHYDMEEISLRNLIEIHLLTHKSTSNHSMRKKYRSAVYAFDEDSKKRSEAIIRELQGDFNYNIITEVLLFEQFKPSDEQFQNYYSNNPNKPFCVTYITPKLTMLRNRYAQKLVGVMNGT